MSWFEVKKAFGKFGLINALLPLFLVALPQLGCNGESTISPQALKASWHNNQGVVYMDQHNYIRGKGEFEQAVQLDPAYANGYANLGIALYSLGKYDSAQVALQTALRHDPEHLNAHYTLGLIYSNSPGREYDRALQAFEKVAQADPDDPQVRYYLGQVRAKKGNVEEAIADFRHAIRLDPHNVSAYYGLAQQLRQAGKQDEWQEVLKTFNRLQEAGHEGVSSSYQGQGKYAEAATDVGYTNPNLDDARGPFNFTAQPPVAGLSAPLRFATATDFDGDGDPDLLVGTDRTRLLRNDGGTLALASEVSLPHLANAVDAVLADSDNDKDVDLVLSGDQTLIMQNDSTGQFVEAAAVAAPSHRAVFADVDHDGDLDLLLLQQDAPQLWANDGAGTFANISDQAGLTGGPPAHTAIFSDFDNDRDVDFVLFGSDAAQLFTNNRDGTFSDIAAAADLQPTAVASACVEDFDQDGYMDLGILGASGSLTLYTNNRDKGFSATSLPALPDGAATDLLSADMDLDGDMDLLAYGPQGLQLLAQHKGTFHLDAKPIETALSQVVVRDFDGNGTPDIWADGQLWSNSAVNPQWVAISIQGLNSNLEGIGAKVEIKTTYRQQKREVRGGSQDAGVLTFGLGQADSVEFIRILWPSGVRQTELATAAAQQISLTELNRKGTSCPILYAWDGEKFRFVTDILGGAIIGYLTAPGQYNTPDTDEYVPLGPIAAKDGFYTLQIANQLEEIIYLDRVELIAVDHPADLTVFPNERLLSAPPYPPFHIYPLEHLRPLEAAVDQTGEDVLPLLREIDDNWYDRFDLTAIHGYAERHTLTLDLGDLSDHSHPVLLAHGWVDYAHSTSNWAAAQLGLSLNPPQLEVPDGNGNWVVAQADMGCPAGLPKHMLVDLKGLFKHGDYRLRISTNAAIYWDQFLVGNAADAPVEVHRQNATMADLHWRGYPAHTAIKGTFAFRYHYDQLNRENTWGTHRGRYTRLGQVTELLHGIDDRYVIMFHGDELTVQFAADALPPLNPGSERTFLLYADGFGKDMDFHSAHSLSVDPLPFHGMSSYPYPPGETYPQTQAHLDYLLEYNTRGVRGYYE